MPTLYVAAYKAAATGVTWARANIGNGRGGFSSDNDAAWFAGYATDTSPPTSTTNDDQPGVTISGLSAGTEYKLWAIWDDGSTSSNGPISSAAWVAKDVGRADETSAALALAARQIMAAGLAAESDVALALSARASRPIGTATESDSALALTPGSSSAVGVATESDAAVALSGRQIRTVGVAAESDEAFELAPNVSGAVGLATEVGTAYALSGVQRRAVGLAVEVGSAQALPLVSARTAGLALEINTSFALGARLVRGVGRADEGDAAFALPVGGGAGPGVYPDPATVLAGIQYGPTGIEYTGTLALLTAAQVWSYPTRGLTERVDADVQAINGVEVTGAGVPGNEWGPA